MSRHKTQLCLPVPHYGSCYPKRPRMSRAWNLLWGASRPTTKSNENSIFYLVCVWVGGGGVHCRYSCGNDRYRCWWAKYGRAPNQSYQHQHHVGACVWCYVRGLGTDCLKPDESERYVVFGVCSRSLAAITAILGAQSASHWLPAASGFVDVVRILRD